MSNWGGGWGSGGVAAKHSSGGGYWGGGGEGILPAEAGAHMSFPESRYQPLPDRAGETAAAVQDAIKAITGILQKRQQDQIANQLLAVDNAPKAVAVDGTKPGSGTPDPVLDSAMQQRNASQNLPWQDSGVVPNYGGTTALAVKEYFDKNQQDAADHALKHDYMMSQIAHNYRPPQQPGLTPDFEYKIRHPELFPKESANDPELTAALHRYNSGVAEIDKAGQMFGVNAEDLGGIDNNTYNAVSLYETPTKFPGQEKLTRTYQGKPVSVGPGDLLSEQDARALISANPSTKESVGSGVMAATTTKDGKKIVLPYENLLELQKRHTALPPKPESNPQAAKAVGQQPDGTQVKQNGVLYEFRNGVAVPVG